MDIANVFAIGNPVGVGTRAGMMVIGQRQARDHLNGWNLGDGTFAMCLSLQMAAN